MKRRFRHRGGRRHPLASSYVALGQISFAFFIALCVALHPGFVLKANEGGLSNYGVHLKTALPYTLAFGLAAFFSSRAGETLDASSPQGRHHRVLLRTYSGLLALTLVSTYGYTLTPFWKDVHIVAGVTTTIFESVASLWMYRVLRRGIFLLAAQLAGFVMATFTFLGEWHVLFLSEVVTGVAFALLLIRTSALLE